MNIENITSNIHIKHLGGIQHYRPLYSTKDLHPIGISMIRVNYKRKLQKIRTREITIEVYPERHKLRAVSSALPIPEREEASAVTLPQLPSIWVGDNRYTKDIIS